MLGFLNKVAGDGMRWLRTPRDWERISDRIDGCIATSEAGKGDILLRKSVGGGEHTSQIRVAVPLQDKGALTDAFRTIDQMIEDRESAATPTFKEFFTRVTSTLQGEKEWECVEDGFQLVYVDGVRPFARLTGTNTHQTMRLSSAEIHEVFMFLHDATLDRKFDDLFGDPRS